MKARLPKGYGRPDPQAMMRQVQKMQDEIRAKQDELEARPHGRAPTPSPPRYRKSRRSWPPSREAGGSTPTATPPPECGTP